MLRSLRRLAVTVLVASLGLSGLSYAGTGAPNPVRSVVDAVRSAEVPDVDDADVSAAIGLGVDEDGNVEFVASVDPDPPVDALVDTLPDGTEGESRPADWSAKWSREDCPEGFEGNHGQYVSSAEDKRAAAHSKCGKPVASENEPEGEDSESAGQGRGAKAEKAAKPGKSGERPPAHSRGRGRGPADD